MTAESIARALNGRRVGSTWMVCCPAHEDRNPSLALKDSGGKLLVKCHAGCRQSDVIAALEARDLWEREPAGDSEIVATYRYTDERGQLLYEVVRKSGKRFLQRHPDSRGGWIWRKHPHQVLYHLPEVLESPIVFCVEGEKDAESLRDHGFVATTNAGGANAPWLPGFTEALRGREVILIPDADPPGRARVANIARALIGHASKIVVLELEGAKDVTEWFERGHNETELIAQLEGEGVAQ